MKKYSASFATSELKFKQQEYGNASLLKRSENNTLMIQIPGHEVKQLGPSFIASLNEK